MKTIYIVTTAHVYDDVRVTHRIAKSFIDNGMIVSWFGPAPLKEPRPFYGIKYYFFYKRKKYARLTSFLQLRKLLKSSQPPDVYFAVDPDSIYIANNLAKKHKTRTVFDIHEIFHKDMLFNHIPSFMVPFFGFPIKLFIEKESKKADLVIGVGETRLLPYKKVIKNSFIIRHCVPVSLVNGFRADPFKAGFNEVKIMQGKVSLQQGTMQLLLAAKKATEITGKVIKVILFKIFSSDLPENEFNEFILNNDLNENLTLLDSVPYNLVFPVLAQCDIGAISYQRQMGIRCMPNRIFEYMALGIPAIVPDYSIEMHSILKNYNCGVECDMQDVNDISSKIVELISNPVKSRSLGLNGFNAFTQECNWEAESKNLMEWIQNP